MALTYAALIGALLAPRAPAADHDASPPGVPIEYRAHLAVIEVFINGRGPYDFVVDTGAGITVFNERLAQELDLPKLGTTGVGSPMGGELMDVDSLGVGTVRIGNVVVENQPAIAMDLDAIFRGIPAPDGILAAGSFAGYLFTIDSGGGIVRVAPGELPPSDGASILDYSATSTVPRVSISVAGEILLASLDTGAPSGLVMPIEYASRLPLASKPVVTGQGRTVDATFDVLSADLQGTLAMGSITIENPRISFSETGNANIGMQILRRYSITIDSANRRVMFAGSPAADEAGSAVRRVVVGGGKKRYGIRLGVLSGDVLDVIGVETGLAAEQGGLRGGDRIVAMNGQPVASLGSEERVQFLRGSPLVLTVERGEDTMEIRLSLD